MKLHNLGPGDEATWGGRSPYPSDEDEMRERIEEEVGKMLYEVLDSAGLSDFYDEAVESQAFKNRVEARIQKLRDDAEERRIEDYLDAQNQW